MKKILIVIGFLTILFIGGAAYVIHIEKWSNVKMHLERLYINTFGVSNNDEEVNETEAVPSDSVVVLQNGNDIVSRFQNEEELLSNADQKLNDYYTYPFTEESRRKEGERFRGIPLKKAAKVPSLDNVQQAFIVYTQGNITSFEERGLRMMVGKCYEDEAQTYEQYAVTCNIMAFSSQKEDLVKTISVLGDRAYNFSYDEDYISKWRVSEARQEIPIDENLYKEYIPYLREKGFIK